MRKASEIDLQLSLSLNLCLSLDFSASALVVLVAGGAPCIPYLHQRNLKGLPCLDLDTGEVVNKERKRI